MLKQSVELRRMTVTVFVTTSDPFPIKSSAALKKKKNTLPQICFFKYQTLDLTCGYRRIELCYYFTYISKI